MHLPRPTEDSHADALVTDAGRVGAACGFLAKLRQRYGVATTLLAVGTGPFAGHVEQVVRERNSAGDRHVRLWALDTTGLDFTGCHWHYSARDHRLLADCRTAFLADLPIRW
ncbi:hypothetical protein [Streptomyces sp. NPDC046832]|uniref:hypothetical protein n=1 Tax=Streptomyces sp. NPDC046832 TaxID=3155020 RepID=UPI0033E0FADA